MTNSGWSVEPEDGKFAVPAVLSMLVVGYFYLVHHPVPSHYGGLYLDISHRILTTGTLLPDRIPGYTPSGLPFAFPPLAFYLVAGLLHLGVEGLTILKILPTFWTVLLPVPVYLFARDFGGSRLHGGLGAFAITIPSVYTSELVATGVTRGPAFLFALFGAWTGYHLFTSGDRHWVVPSILCFALTVLLHPIYAKYFVLTYLAFFVALNRQQSGFIDGLIVGLGGIAVATPWWMTVAATHGGDVFVNAAHSREWIVAFDKFVTRFIEGPLADYVRVWQAIAGLGGVVLLVRKQVLLPLWFATLVFFQPDRRFMYFVAGLMATTLVADAALHVSNCATGSILPKTIAGRRVNLALVGVVLVGVLATPGAAGYAASDHWAIDAELTTEDVKAMHWVQTNTTQNAEFVVVGDQAEWFPWFSKRTTLVTPMGSEWRPPAKREQQRRLKNRLRSCESGGCIARIVRESHVDPDYLYVAPSKVETATELAELPNYSVVYQRDGVTVLKVRK